MNEKIYGCRRIISVICSDTDITLTDWLNKYICPSEGKNGSITVIDLSLLPAEVTHIITSVMARVTLEVLQRYRRQNGGNTLPTVLVMEEAHTFIKRYNNDVKMKVQQLSVAPSF